MRIVHIHLLGPYTDGWGYQENILPEVQARAGHEVTIIVNCQTHLPDNSIKKVAPADYERNGVRIIRIDYEKIFPGEKLNQLVFTYPVTKLLRELQPDAILLHGMGRGFTNFEVRRYIHKHPKCALYGDVHAFAGNSEAAKSWKTKLINMYSDICRRILYGDYRVVFCISQQCLEYARDAYGIPEEKLVLFPLGYDPANIPWDNRENIRGSFRERFGIGLDELVIVHGGKIIPRRKTEMAIEAVRKLEHKVRLVVFGAIADELRESLLEQISSCENVVYLGHLSQEEYLKVFLASDIAFFPGAQSSMWEEAIGCGLPLLINITEEKDLPYFDRGGNIAITKDDSVESCYEELNRMIATQDYKQMAAVAQTQGREFFSYERIAAIMTAVEE